MPEMNCPATNFPSRCSVLAAGLEQTFLGQSALPTPGYPGLV